MVCERALIWPEALRKQSSIISSPPSSFSSMLLCFCTHTHKRREKKGHDHVDDDRRCRHSDGIIALEAYLKNEDQR